MTEHHHITPEHIHTHETHEPFPAAEEDLFISLVRAAENTTVSPANLPKIIAPHVEARLTDVRARLGEKWHGPSDKQVREDIAANFSQQYEGLPTSHPLFEGQPHDHTHGDHSCGKLHGPVRKQLDRLENAMLRRVRNHTARAIAAGVFRLSALTICPGDDILAIGLQVHSSIVGHHESEHEHHEEYAILPTRPRIVVELPAQREDEPTPDTI